MMSFSAPLGTTRALSMGKREESKYEKFKLSHDVWFSGSHRSLWFPILP